MFAQNLDNSPVMFYKYQEILSEYKTKEQYNFFPFKIAVNLLL